MSNVPETERPSEARLRHQLDVQSQQINRVLSHHHVPATVTGGTVRPRVVQFDLQTQINAGIERIRGLKGDLISALGVGDVAVTGDDGRWRLNVARPDDPPVPLLKLMASISTLPPRTIPIGLADGGQPVILGFPANRMSHVLIAGEPGAGKTSLLRAMAVGLALSNRQAQCQIQIIDPQWEDGERLSAQQCPLLPLGYLPHMLTDPAFGMAASVAIIDFLAEEMAYRRRERVQCPHIVVFVDHVVSLLESAAAKTRSDVIRLLQYGSQAGIHLVMTTDRPHSPLLDSTIKSCLATRLIGRITDAAVARRAGGVQLDQAPLLYGEGDFLAVTGEEVTYFQAAHIGDYDLHHTLAELGSHSRPRLLARPYSARPRVEIDRGNGRAQPVPFSVRGGVVDLGKESEPEEEDDPDSIPF